MQALCCGPHIYVLTILEFARLRLEAVTHAGTLREEVRDVGSVSQHLLLLSVGRQLTRRTFGRQYARETSKTRLADGKYTMLWET